MALPDPLSITEARAWPAAPTRSCCAHPGGGPGDAHGRPPAPGRRRAVLPARVGRGRRARRALLASSASGRAASWRCATAARIHDAAGRRRRLHPGPAGDHVRGGRSAGRAPGVRAAPPVAPTDGMPRFTGGAVGALAYDAVGSLRAAVPLPAEDPVGVPLAGFLETDLVLVFDHLTQTLSRDRLAPHRDARPGGPLPHRRAGHLRGAGADPGPARRRWPARGRRGPAGAGAGTRRRGGRGAAWAGTRTRRRSWPPSRPSRPARRSRSCSPAARRWPSRRAPTAGRSAASTSTARCGASTPARTSSSCATRPSRSSGPAPSSCCASRATR